MAVDLKCPAPNSFSKLFRADEAAANSPDLLVERCLSRQFVGALVFGVACVAFDPFPVDIIIHTQVV